VCGAAFNDASSYRRALSASAPVLVLEPSHLNLAIANQPQWASRRRPRRPATARSESRGLPSARALRQHRRHLRSNHPCQCLSFRKQAAREAGERGNL